MSENIIVKDLQKLDPGSELVCLYELEYVKGSFIYFMSGLDTDLTTVQMRDYNDNSQINTYIAIPAQLQGLEYKNDGAIARPLISIANASNAFSNAIGTIDYDSFLGLKFIKRTTLKKYLHGEASATNPPTEFPRDLYVMDRIKAKTKSAEEVGIEVIDHHLDNKITQNNLISLINKLNNQENVNGILVQLPLPNHINEQVVLDSINPDKDADGFHPLNVGRLSISSTNDENLLIPCTPYGCLLMLKGLNLELKGKNAVVIGRSNIVGKPMSQLLLKESCTVTIAHSKTKDLPNVCRGADILIAAVGKPQIVKGDWIKDNAVVIDVGINRIQKEIKGEVKNKLVGDVDYEEVSKKALAVTPVPGGVGPMTIACLLRNTTIAFKNSKK